ncbi:hypothetical protein [Luteimonas aquatica]|uniref:hypothetical protein n=1 Tax=Luteimonas aquatica TaxID=450364 RepID=UPI001F55B27D|nr:hypothetical protein [Luteimonas aquatica]
MRDLFKAELQRFRLWAAAYALVHLLALGFLAKLVDLAQQPSTPYELFAAIYAATGLLLGLYQMGGYRRPNAWLNLLHGPVPHWRVATALLGACFVLLAVAVLLPLLLVALWQGTMTARVVDTRHLLLCGSGWLMAACGYLAGCYAMLANRRYGFCALLFIPLFVFGQATGAGTLIVQGAALAYLAAMVLIAFKPELSAPPRGAAVALTAAPLTMTMWFALLLVGFAVEFVWIAQGSHPNNRAVPIAGGEKEAENAKGAEMMAIGLRDSAAPEARLWREQAKISEIFGLSSYLRAVPVRHELTNLAPMEFDDETRRVRWVFSHDRMRFQGYGLVDKRPAGSLGVAGDRPFPAPPLPGPDNLLVSREAVYQYDGDAGLILPRAQLPAGEVLAGYGPVGDDMLLLSDRALYFYDLAGFSDDDVLLRPRQRVPLPGRVGDLARLDLMELLDGYLVSFTFARWGHNAEGADSFQSIVRVDAHGPAVQVARRAIGHDYPDLWRYQNWWVSPPLYAAQKAITGLFSGYVLLRDTDPPPVPRRVVLVALALMLLSMLAAIWRTAKLALSMPARVAWIVICGAFGIPALMALWLLYPPRESLEEVPLGQAAAA